MSTDIHPTRKTLEEFKKYHRLDGTVEAEALYRNYLAVQKQYERKKKSYRKKREEFLAHTPEEQLPKVGRPRKIPIQELALQEKLQHTKDELEALKKELEELKQKKQESTPAPAPTQAPALTPTRVLKETYEQTYPSILDNTKVKRAPKQTT